MRPFAVCKMMLFVLAIASPHPSFIILPRRV